MDSRLPWMVICGALLEAGAAHSGGMENLASRKWLPSGPGLAAAFPGDRGIEGHPEVIFADGFEKTALGAGWDETGNAGGSVLSLAAAGAGREGNCLRVEATLGKNTGGGLTKWFTPAGTVHVRFLTKFDGACGYIHHFVTLRANRSLRGADKWSGFGGAGLRPDGARRFSTALEPWGNFGEWPVPGRWNLYTYWHGMEPSRDGRYWGTIFGVPEQPVIPKEKWICGEFMLKHNTPGKADGEQAFWIDGTLQGHWKGISRRTDPDLMANALTLESYVTDRWTAQQTNVVFFDQVVIARNYIGPPAG